MLMASVKSAERKFGLSKRLFLLSTDSPKNNQSQQYNKGIDGNKSLKKPKEKSDID